jgi:hypothetical protein
MTKTAQRDVVRIVREKRRQLTSIREEVEDLMDCLDLVEARAKNGGKPTISHEEMKKRFA